MPLAPPIGWDCFLGEKFEFLISNFEFSCPNPFVSARLFLLFLLLPPLSRADLQWASATVFTVVAPSEGRATAQFTFTNTGNYPIKVIGTHTSCGCTAAVSDGRPVAPGQTGKIDVSFKTLNRRGLYEEPILIDTNDPNAKQSTVTLRVLIRDAVELLPTLLFWQQGEPLTSKVIRITATEGYNVKGIDATCPDPAVQLHLDTIKPGADYKLTVTPVSQHVKATISVTPDIEGKPPRVFTAHVRVS
jgi:hypothetical protein